MLNRSHGTLVIAPFIDTKYHLHDFVKIVARLLVETEVELIVEQSINSVAFIQYAYGKCHI